MEIMFKCRFVAWQRRDLFCVDFVLACLLLSLQQLTTGVLLKTWVSEAPVYYNNHSQDFFAQFHVFSSLTSLYQHDWMNEWMDEWMNQCWKCMNKVIFNWRNKKCFTNERIVTCSHINYTSTSISFHVNTVIHTYLWLLHCLHGKYIYPPISSISDYIICDAA